jgi:hypothetical protein
VEHEIAAEQRTAEPAPGAFDLHGGSDLIIPVEHGDLPHLHEIHADRVVDGGVAFELVIANVVDFDLVMRIVVDHLVVDRQDLRFVISLVPVAAASGAPLALRKAATSAGGVGSDRGLAGPRELSLESGAAAGLAGHGGFLGLEGSRFPLSRSKALAVPRAACEPAAIAVKCYVDAICGGVVEPRQAPRIAATLKHGNIPNATPSRKITGRIRSRSSEQSL